MHSEVNPEAAVLDNEHGVDITEQQHIVRSAVNRLSHKHRQVVILCDLEGFSREEAAEILGSAVGTIRSRLHYARNKLKHLLKDYIAEL